MTRSRPLVLEQLEDRTAPAAVSAAVPGVPATLYPDPEAGPPTPPVRTFVTGALGGGQADTRLLEVVDGQQFHFILSGTDPNAPAGTELRMTISDTTGRVVFVLATDDGASWSGDVFLGAGPYRVGFSQGTAVGEAPAHFALSGWGLFGWGWVGPELRDTTQQPLDPSATASAPALSSFFFLPGNSADLFATAAAPQGPSFRVGESRPPSDNGAALTSPTVVAPSSPRVDAIGLLAGGGGAGAPGADAPPAPPQPLASVAVSPASVGRDADGGQTEQFEAAFAAEGGAVAASPVVREVLTTAVPTNAPRPVVANVGSPAELLNLGGDNPVSNARLFWACWLGAAVLSSLALPARWCAVLFPERLRLAAGKPREVPTSV
jgi:hypothetical protein